MDQKKPRGRKRILLVSQYFHPEGFKCNDLAFDWVKRGYEVDVLTGLPNYPSGRIASGYGYFRRRTERIEGVRVFRAALVPRGRGGGVRLVLNYLSWAFCASLWAFVLALRNRYDCVVVHETSPVTQGIPAVAVKWIRRIPLYFWVLDLWPESLVSAGGIRNRSVLRCVERLVRWLYDRSDRILISSQGFRESILAKGDYADRIVYLPNWAEDVFEGACDYPLPELPDGFRVMFAGNIGEAQDMETVLDAALRLRGRRDIRWLLVGDGRKRAWAEEFVRRHDLSENVRFLGRYPLEAMPAFFRAADAMLVSLKDEKIFRLTVPAKLQAYMAAGRPVVAMLGGEGHELVRKARCGIAVEAGNGAALADAVLRAAACSAQELARMGANGHEYYLRHFTKRMCIDRFTEVIEEVG